MKENYKLSKLGKKIFKDTKDYFKFEKKLWIVFIIIIIILNISVWMI